MCVIDCQACAAKWLYKHVLCVMCMLCGAVCPLHMRVLSIINRPFHVRKKGSPTTKDVETSIKVSSFAKEWVSSQPKRAPMVGVRVRPCSSMDRMEVS